jgi:hypothetical protein
MVSERAETIVEKSDCLEKRLFGKTRDWRWVVGGQNAIPGVRRSRHTDLHLAAAGTHGG